MKWNDDNKMNVNDHNGYQIKDLFVEPKYITFKDELMNYPHLNIKHYHKIIIPKLNAYVQTHTFRTMLPNILYDRNLMRSRARISWHSRYGMSYKTIYDKV